MLTGSVRQFAFDHQRQCAADRWTTLAWKNGRRQLRSARPAISAIQIQTDIAENVANSLSAAFGDSCSGRTRSGWDRAMSTAQNLAAARRIETIQPRDGRKLDDRRRGICLCDAGSCCWIRNYADAYLPARRITLNSALHNAFANGRRRSCSRDAHEAMQTARKWR